MATCNRFAFRIVVGLLIVTVCHIAVARAGDELPKAMLDGNGPDWVSLGEDDFENVNCDPETWSWKDGVRALYWHTNWRNSHKEAIQEFRTGRSVAAPQTSG